MNKTNLQTVVSTDHDDHHHDEHEVHEEGELKESGLTTNQSFKIGMIFVMLIINLAGLLPSLTPCIRKNEALLSYINCFSAGIFLALALVHMLPESVVAYNEWGHEKGYENLFPLPYVMMFTGYMIVLCLDRVIMAKIIHYHTKKNECVIVEAKTAA
jgi:hypothetical protein